MFDCLVKLYEGEDLSGATPGVIYLPILDFGRVLGEIVVKTDADISGADAVFQLKLNGEVIAGAEAITVAVGNKISDALDSLEIELTQGDELVLDLLSGDISSPVTLSLFTTIPVYTDDIEEVADKRYVTDAEKTKLANTSGFNTGDQDLSGYATKTGAETLTNKTLTAPVINSPTGIVKADVGLGNVDNTSDASKNSAAVTLTNKTLTTPTIGSFANASHNHQDAAGGGTLAESALALTDITTNNASTSKHGFLKKLSSSATEYMDGTGNWSTPAGGGGGGGSGDMLKSTYDTNNNSKVDLAEDSEKLGGTAAASFVTKAGAETLTNKTLTAPAISSPTGLVKGDVGLGSVDNTSDATKNSAAVTLTNKTLTSPVINSPTGIVKGDVGLGNVDNTSNTTERAATATLTNKRITPRIGTTASSSTPTPDADAHDQYNVTALAAGATFGAPSGTPTDGQPLIIRIKDDGTARALAFNAIYRAIGFVLPTTTVISKTIYLACLYNAAASKWDVVGYSPEL